MKKQKKKQKSKMEKFLSDAGILFNSKDNPDETKYTAVVSWIDNKCVRCKLIYGTAEKNTTLDQFAQQIKHEKEQEYGKQDYKIIVFPGYIEEIADRLMEIQQEIYRR